MLSQLQTAVRRGGKLSLNGLRRLPVWGAAWLVASMLYKLDWLDHQFNVGGMNEWKWLVNGGATLIAVFWTLWLGRRSRAVALTLVNLLMSVTAFADLVYFRYFKDFISVPVLLQAGQVSSLEDSIWSLIRPEDWILFADLPFAVAATVWILLRYRKSRLVRLRMPDFRTGSPWWLRTGLAAVLLAAGILMIAIPVDQQKNGWARGLFGGNWWNVPIYNVTGLFGFHGYDAYRYAKEHWFGGGLSDAEIAEAKAWLDHQQSVQQQAEKEPLFGKYKGKNVLIVQAEAFQTFVLNRSINGQEITPNLNKLIGQSLYFPNFYHQTGQGRTSDADFLTNCSLHPMPTGSVFVRFADHSFDCLPQMLKADGYDSTVHHAYDGSFWNRNNMYHNMQYDKFYNIKDFTIDEPLGWSLGDKSFFRQTVQQLKDRGKEPFYAMTITLSSHHPYHIPSAFELDVGEFSGSVFGDYLQAAHYVDEAVGVLVDELKKAGLWDDTILMFYGDHDNSITDWSVYEKFYGHAMSPLEKELQLKKVPFFIHFPNDENAGVNEKAAGQLDIAPTVLDLLGISTKPYHLMGLSLMTDTPKPVVFRSGSYTDGNVYFVSAGDGTPEHGTCYSMKTGAQTDIAACSAGARAAHDELVMSDRIVEYDLLPVFRQEEAAAAGAK